MKIIDLLNNQINIYLFLNRNKWRKETKTCENNEKCLKKVIFIFSKENATVFCLITYVEKQQNSPIWAKCKFA